MLGVRSLALFGSVARDQAGPDSDVDLLVEFSEVPRKPSTLIYENHRIGWQMDAFLLTAPLYVRYYSCYPELEQFRKRSPLENL